MITRSFCGHATRSEAAPTIRGQGHYLMAPTKPNYDTHDKITA